MLEPLLEETPDSIPPGTLLLHPDRQLEDRYLLLTDRLGLVGHDPEQLRPLPVKVGRVRGRRRQRFPGPPEPLRLPLDLVQTPRVRRSSS